MISGIQPPETLHSHFYVKTLSDGRDTTTTLYEDSTNGRKHVIKIVPKSSFKSENEISNYTKKITQLKALRHPNLLYIEDFTSDDFNFYIITKYCQKGDLDNYIFNSGPFSENVGRNFFRSLVTVVSFLHEKGITHRDLNLENILLESDFNIVFAGLDFSPRDPDPILLRHTNLLYLAPEIIKGQSHTQIYTDMWSLGVILYSIICGRMPWVSSDEAVLAGQISNSSFVFPLCFSTELTDLIKGLLEANPILRLGPEDALSHSWMRKPRRSSMKNQPFQYLVPVCSTPSPDMNTQLTDVYLQKERNEHSATPKSTTMKKPGRPRTTTYSFVKKMPPLL